MAKETAKQTANRTGELIKAVGDFNAEHDAWVQAENRPNPDKRYWEAVDTLLQTFEGDIPADCRDLNNAVVDFYDEVNVFDEREATANHYPHAAFWAARERLAAVAVDAGRVERVELESIAELHRQDVPHAQIAKIWNLVDRHGEAIPHMVQRELDKPGSVIGAKSGSNLLDGADWVDPRDSTAVAPQVRPLKSEEAPAPAAPCPESPEELWEQGVSADQAAKMLLQPLDEVQFMWQEFNAAREKDTVTA